MFILKVYFEFYPDHRLKHESYETKKVDALTSTFKYNKKELVIILSFEF